MLILQSNQPETLVCYGSRYHTGFEIEKDMYYFFYHILPISERTKADKPIDVTFMTIY